MSATYTSRSVWGNSKLLLDTKHSNIEIEDENERAMCFATLNDQMPTNWRLNFSQNKFLTEEHFFSCNVLSQNLRKYMNASFIDNHNKRSFLHKR